MSKELQKDCIELPKSKTGIRYDTVMNNEQRVEWDIALLPGFLHLVHGSKLRVNKNIFCVGVSFKARKQSYFQISLKSLSYKEFCANVF